MSLRLFLTVSAIVAFVFGLAFVLLPGTFAGFYGVSLDPAGTIFAQLFGAAVLGFGALNWFARGVHNHDADSLRPVLLGNLVSDGLGFVIALLSQLSGAAGVNALGWSTVLIYGLLAAGCAYFLFGP